MVLKVPGCMWPELQVFRVLKIGCNYRKIRVKPCINGNVRVQISSAQLYFDFTVNQLIRKFPAFSKIPTI